jgi:GGDEF domain-containing protein
VRTTRITPTLAQGGGLTGRERTCRVSATPQRRRDIASLEGSLPAASDPVPLHSRFVARLGGEEFLVALPGMEMGAAKRALQEVRNAVATYEWSRVIGPLSLTVSIGAAAARNGDTRSSILARADHNLYVAKAAGRDRLVVDEHQRGAG